MSPEQPNSNQLEVTAEDNERKKKVLSHTVEARMRTFINDAKRDGSAELSKQEVLRVALDNLVKKLKEVIPEKDREISAVAESLAGSDMEDKEEFIKKVSSDIAEFLFNNYTTQELEQIARRYSQYKNVVLNRLVEYGITDNTLHIHSPLTFIENPIELRSLFIDALRKLADKLKNDPELAHIELITASSWIVAKAPTAFKKAGFTIIEIDKDSGEAEITREKLIELYG